MLYTDMNSGVKDVVNQKKVTVDIVKDGDTISLKDYTFMPVFNLFLWMGHEERDVWAASSLSNEK